MDNKAFASLVRAGVKSSSRDSVRQTFETDIQGKKKTKKRRSADSNSDDEDRRRVSRRAHQQQEHRDGKRKTQTLQQQKQPTNEEELSNYRDRARERREGSHTTSNGAKSAEEQIFDDVVDALENGDRLKLAQLSTVSITIEDHRVSSQQQQQQQVEEGPPVTFQEALDCLDRRRHGPPTAISSLGKEIEDFLRIQYGTVDDNMNESAQASNLAWQPSVLTFSWNSADGVQRAWERPVERTYAAAGTVQFLKGTPCTPGLLKAMDQSLCRSKHSHLSTTEKPPRPNGSDDEDDDIFGGVGDYDGATACMRQDADCSALVAARNTRETGQSMFGKAKTSELPQDYPTATTKLVGFASYGDNDDDGIGMDFDGRDYDEDVPAKQKKKKRRKKSDDSDDD